MGIGSNRYGYSSENMLKTGPGGVSLDYDPLGRLYQTAGGSTTRFRHNSVAASSVGSNPLAIITATDCYPAGISANCHLW